MDQYLRDLEVRNDLTIARTLETIVYMLVRAKSIAARDSLMNLYYLALCGSILIDSLDQSKLDREQLTCLLAFKHIKEQTDTSIFNVVGEVQLRQSGGSGKHTVH